MQELGFYSSGDFPRYLPKLTDLYDDLFAGGKGFRSQLIQKISSHLNLDDKTILLLSQTIEFIHNASLLHDDLIDRAPLRRGKTTAWLKYSPECAVLAGDYLLARVIVNLCDFGKLSLVKFTGKTISDLLEGEWLQDLLLHRWDVTWEELNRVHKLKTSSLFKWCFQAPFLANGKEFEPFYPVLGEMGDMLGQLFQRSDDLLDFDVRNIENKKILGDLKSGYLNSFGLFLSEKSPETSSEKTSTWSKSQSIEELKTYLGEKTFQSCVEGFDKENQKIIDNYHELNKKLKTLLPQENQSVCQDFEWLPSIIYWRGVKK